MQQRVNLSEEGGRRHRVKEQKGSCTKTPLAGSSVSVTNASMDFKQIWTAGNTEAQLLCIIPGQEHRHSVPGREAPPPGHSRCHSFWTCPPGGWCGQREWAGWTGSSYSPPPDAASWQCCRALTSAPIVCRFNVVSRRERGRREHTT